MDFSQILKSVEMFISFFKNMLAQQTVQRIFENKLIGKKVTCFTSEGKIEGTLLEVSEEGILKIDDGSEVIDVSVQNVSEIFEHRNVVVPPLSERKAFEGENITVNHSTGRYIGKCVFHGMSFVQLVENDGTMVELHGDIAILLK